MLENLSSGLWVAGCVVIIIVAIALQSYTVSLRRQKQFWHAFLHPGTGDRETRELVAELRDILRAVNAVPVETGGITKADIIHDQLVKVGYSNRKLRRITGMTAFGMQRKYDEEGPFGYFNEESLSDRFSRELQSRWPSQAETL